MFSFLMLALSLVAVAEDRELVSEETVPVHFYPGALECQDKRPDQGFGAVPLTLRVIEKRLLDRTQRVKNAEPYAELKDTEETCATLAPKLQALPPSLVAIRKVYRINQGKRTTLESEIAIELPKIAILQGMQYWFEWNRDLGNEFHAISHPQAGEGVGLTCQGDTLSVSVAKEHSGNVSQVRRAYASNEACQDARGELLEIFRAEDPDNWGTLVKVKRTLETRVRYTITNMAKPACQEIQLETRTAEVRGRVFRGAAAFPLRMVDMKECFEARSKLNAAR